MIKVYDVTNIESTVFNDLDVEDYFITPNEDAIWRKLNQTTAIQITDNTSFLMARAFARDVQVTKIEITSIVFKKTK